MPAQSSKGCRKHRVGVWKRGSTRNSAHRRAVATLLIGFGVQSAQVRAHEKTRIGKNTEQTDLHAATSSATRLASPRCRTDPNRKPKTSCLSAMRTSSDGSCPTEDSSRDLIRSCASAELKRSCTHQLTPHCFRWPAGVRRHSAARRRIRGLRSRDPRARLARQPCSTDTINVVGSPALLRPAAIGFGSCAVHAGDAISALRRRCGRSNSSSAAIDPCANVARRAELSRSSSASSKRDSNPARPLRSNKIERSVPLTSGSVDQETLP